jgi:DNA topoisomerase-3
MGDDNVELVKSIYDKLRAKYAGTSWEEAIEGSDPMFISNDNKRLFNSADLQDHHALIPLAPLSEALSVDETNIYKLVFQRFFIVLKPPYIYNSLTICGNISEYAFQGSGIEIIRTGWKTGNGEDEENKEKDYKYSCPPEPGKYPVINMRREEKQTEPKKHYTFASLLQLMENPRGGDGRHLAGLGTPATRGAILQKLVDRKYVTLKGKNVLISDDGKFLIENILKNNELAAFISVPETTRWEEQLHDNTAAFIESIKDFVRSAVKTAGMDAYQHEKTSLGKCPLCGGDVYEGGKNYYCGNYKGEKPCRFTVWKEICKAAVSPSDAQTLLAGKKTKVKKCASSKTGKEFQAAFALEKDKVVFVFQDRKG